MLSAYSKNKDAAAKLIRRTWFPSKHKKSTAIKLSRLPTLPAVYKDKGRIGRSAVVCAITARFRECSRASFDGNRRRLQQSVDGFFPDDESGFSTGQCLLRKG